ncbi:TRAP transporter large permease [Mycolicibacterium bacteremicum]|uniref:TRAP transporter large permease n=1 Tax=Mycolicibacterium bacteremicum TaxID=564198 RepID=UPI0026EA20A2|nr:TRAP transporter large permease [Mycolicibacterium bacteremicum]
MTAATIGALIVVLALFFALLAIRLHVGLALMLSALAGVLILRGTGAAVSTVANQPFSTAAEYSLTIIPLFIVMGVFAVRAGLAQAAFDLATSAFRQLPGGPALASLAGSGMFAAVTGSSVATVATMARVSTDAIVRAGYNIKLAAGVVCAGGTLGVLIPPSIVLVLYGVVTEESIGQLLIAGIGPGLLTIAVYAVTIVALVAWQRRRAAGRAEALVTTGSGSATGDVTNAPEDPRSRDITGFLYLVVIFAVSVGTIYLGVATPTEAASFGAFAALIILLLRSRPSAWLRNIEESLREAVGLTAMTFLLMVGAGVFTYVLALSGASTSLVNAVTSADLPPYVVLVACLAVLLPLGMFLDGISMILIAAPLLHPILTGYGFDGIWIGVLIVKVAEMALITPPVGMNAFVYSGAVREAGLGRVFRGIVPFVVADLIVVALLIAFPAVVTFLPSMSGAQ